MLIVVELTRIVNQISVAIHTSLFVTRPGIDYITVGEHGAALIGDMKQIAVALLALVVLEGGICLLPIPLMVIGVLGKVNDYVLDAVEGLGVEEINGVLGSGQMTVHAVRHKTLLVIYMAGGFPTIIGKPDFMAGGTKLGCCGADHGVIGETEEGKGDYDPKANEDGWLDKPFHFPPYGA